MNKSTILILAVVIILCLVAPGYSLENRYEWVKVIRVVDGGTFKAVKDDGTLETVRLIGVDAPLTTFYLIDNDNPKESVFTQGQTAKKSLEMSIKDKRIRLSYPETKRDKTGNLYAYVWQKNNMLNKELIENGLVYLDLTDPISKEYLEDFCKCKKHAIEKAYGIWDIGSQNLEEAEKTLKKYENTQTLYKNTSLGSDSVLTNTEGDLAKVTRVIDGDTIVVTFPDGHEEKVRLIGVDTPETKHPQKSVEYFGKEASEYTRKNLNGKNIKLTYDQTNRDRYGRLLAYVWVDGSLFNELLIREGYSYAYLKYPFRSDYMELFRDSQKYAMTYNRGLWNGKCYSIDRSTYRLPKVRTSSSGIYYRKSSSNNSSSNYYYSGYSSGSYSSSGSGSGSVQVRGYYRKDGTYVRSHTRRRPRSH